MKISVLFFVSSPRPQVSSLDIPYEQYVIIRLSGLFGIINIELDYLSSSVVRKIKFKIRSLFPEKPKTLVNGKL